MPSLKLNKNPATATDVIFTLMLMTIFVAELVTTALLLPLISRFGIVSASLLDAAILVMLFALPLWFFVIQPLSVKNSLQFKRPELLFPALLTAIFLTEFSVMMTLQFIMPEADGPTIVLTDACLTTLLSTPPLWWLIYGKTTRGERLPPDDLLVAPLRLFALLVFMVFLSDLLMDILSPYLSRQLPPSAYLLVDASLSTLIIAALLWGILILPLKRRSQSQHSLLNAVYTQAVDAIISIDAAGIIRSFNPAAEKLFGYTAAELIGMHIGLLFDGRQQGPDAILRSMTECSSSEGNSVAYETNGRCRDGSLVTVDVSVSRILLEGQLKQLIVMRNVSDRKRMEQALRASEDHFRQIFEQSDDAIFFFKPGSGTVIDINATAEKLFGHTKAELQGTGLERIASPAELARLVQAISTISTDKGAFLEKVGCIHRDGSEIIVSMRGKVMTLHQVTIIYCTFRDVTERLHVEQEAREIQAKLIQVNKMAALGLMVSGVAHEINNPNNFIMANAQLLKRSWSDSLAILREYYRENGEFFIGGVPFSELDARSPGLFDGMLEGSGRIIAIIDNLKKFARNDLSLDASLLDVNQVASSAVAILNFELTKFTDHFHVELAENIPLVRGSSQQLGQIIINLLMNACQSLPDRERSIWLTTGMNAAADLVVLSVRDEGQGMSPEKSKLIMEPFFTTKLDSGGTGLGLSICRSIARDHSWSLDFTSEPDKGSTFTVSMPANADKELPV